MRNQANNRTVMINNRPMPIFDVNRRKVDNLGLSSYDRIRLPPNMPTRFDNPRTVFGDASSQILNQTRQVKNQQNQRKGVFGYFKGLLDSVFGAGDPQAESAFLDEDELSLQ